MNPKTDEHSSGAKYVSEFNQKKIRFEENLVEPH
jgi:hypothetical protein